MNQLLNPVVQTSSGKIQGSRREGLQFFLGIPYAAPPVGNLRWLPPQPLKPWEGLRPARTCGPAAPQNPSQAKLIREFSVEEEQSEDCLYLNIWTPAADRLRRPVMVWIHGGVFTMGSGAQPCFDGSILASRRDIVVVTLNYRLGLLGFLNLNEITGGKIPATGNEGLLDQIAALEWIKENIEAFGGDPDNITIFGESAGAASIECLMTMPQAQGLFHKAILQSSLSRSAHHISDALKLSERVMMLMETKEINPASLQKLPVTTLLSIQKDLTSEKYGKFTFGPVVDGKVLPQLPVEAFRHGSVSGIPIIIGTNQEEFRLFSALSARPDIDEITLIKRAKTLLNTENVAESIEHYRKLLQLRGATATPADILIEIQTDYYFRQPAREILEDRCHNQQTVFNYLFSWQSPASGGKYGACHGLEIGFVFGHYDTNFCGSGPSADRLSTKIQAAWTSFAGSGNPACPELGEWPPYCENRSTLILGKDCQIVHSSID